MTGIKMKDVTRQVRLPDGRHETVFKDFSLRVGQNERVGLFGPNGCGKTTLLNIVSGIVRPDCGEVLVCGKKPSEVRIAYIFQNYRSSLFPWLSIKANILFPLSIRKLAKREMAERLEKVICLSSPRFDLNKYPYQLSGGQQQYVTIIRGLVSEPAAMLMDEPFSALDYSNSLWLVEKMSEILAEIKIPTLIVAHDTGYLSCLTDRVCLLSEKPMRIVKEQSVKEQPVTFFNRFASLMYGA